MAPPSTSVGHDEGGSVESEEVAERRHTPINGAGSGGGRSVGAGADQWGAGADQWALDADQWDGGRR